MIFYLQKINQNSQKNSFISETGKQIAAWLRKHEKNTNKEIWNKSAIAEHKRTCRRDIRWEEGTETIAIAPNKFQRKVRGALEIPHYETAPKNIGLNQNDGQLFSIGKLYLLFWKNKSKKRENTVLPCDVTWVLALFSTFVFLLMIFH